MAGDNGSEAIICEKAQQLFDELCAKVPSTSTGPVKEFFGTNGCVTGFRTRAGLHSVVRHGEAATGDRDAEEHCGKFKKIIEEGGFDLQQVFNCVETGLFWKRMPHRTYIMKEETTLPGHKLMKDQLTLLFCANASGDCKVKPLLMYHSENPRTFKNIRKNPPWNFVAFQPRGLGDQESFLQMGD